MPTKKEIQRQKKKEQLRSQIVPEQDKVDIEIKRHKIRVVLVSLVLIVLLSVCIVGILYYNKHKSYKTAVVEWEKEVVIGEMHAQEHNGGVLVAGLEGVFFYGVDGEAKWANSYSMINPHTYIGGEYVAVADIGGKSLGLYGQQGHIKSIQLAKSIYNVSVSKKGVIVVVTQDEMSHSFDIYDKTLTEIGITVNTLISETGYPTSIGISPDGETLIVGYQYIMDGHMKNRVAFYNFREGKKDIKRLVGIFNDYEESLFVEAMFIGPKNAVAIADNRLVFYEMQETKVPKELANIPQKNVKEIITTEQKVAVVTQKKDGTDFDTLTIYNNKGENVLNKKMDFIYKGIGLNSEFIYYYNDTTICIMDYDGEEIFKKEISEAIHDVYSLKNKERFIVQEQNILKGIRIK